MTSDADGIRDRLRAALPAAIKARDRTATGALRSALAAIENAEAVAVPVPVDQPGKGRIAGASRGVGSADVPRSVLEEHHEAEIVRGEILARHRAADVYEQAGHPRRAQQLRDEANVLVVHLGD